MNKRVSKKYLECSASRMHPYFIVMTICSVCAVSCTQQAATGLTVTRHTRRANVVHTVQSAVCPATHRLLLPRRYAKAATGKNSMVKVFVAPCVHASVSFACWHRFDLHVDVVLKGCSKCIEHTDVDYFSFVFVYLLFCLSLFESGYMGLEWCISLSAFCTCMLFTGRFHSLACLFNNLFIIVVANVCNIFAFFVDTYWLVYLPH